MSSSYSIISREEMKLLSAEHRQKMRAAAEARDPGFVRARAALARGRQTLREQYQHRQAERAAAAAEAQAQATEKAEVVSLKAKMHSFFIAKSKRLRIQIMRDLFTRIIRMPAMLAASPQFRAAVRGRIAVFRAEPLASSLLPLLAQTEAFLASLPAHPAYRV